MTTSSFFNSGMGKIVGWGIAVGIVLGVAFGTVSSKDIRPGNSGANAGITKEEFKAELRDALDPLRRHDEEQARQIRDLSIELANLKGRLQLAGLTTRGRSGAAVIQQ